VFLLQDRLTRKPRLKALAWVGPGWIFFWGFATRESAGWKKQAQTEVRQDGAHYNRNQLKSK